MRLWVLPGCPLFKNVITYDILKCRSPLALGYMHSAQRTYGTKRNFSVDLPYIWDRFPVSVESSWLRHSASSARLSKPVTGVTVQYLQVQHRVGHATTNECYNECYKEQFLSIKSGCYNEHRCYNEWGGIFSAEAARACAQRVRPPALIRASVIFVIVCKNQLSV